MPHYYAYYRSGNAEYFLHTLVWERYMGSELPKGFLVDHIDGDKLNNCRPNLRLATRSHNEANKKKRRSNTSSKYKGVTRVSDGRKKCWRTTITYEEKGIHIGTFYSEIEAAMAYNKAALDLFQEFALVNTFEDESDEDVMKAEGTWKLEYEKRPSWGTKTFTAEELIPPWEREKDEDE